MRRSTDVDLVDDLLRSQKQIEDALTQLDGVQDARALQQQLKALRPQVDAHLTEKDAFYPRLKSLCTEANDTAGAHLAGIFETNMKVQSGGVRRFFETIDTTPLAQLTSSYRTVANMLRQRFGTESKAIFPIYRRNLKPMS